MFKVQKSCNVCYQIYKFGASFTPFFTQKWPEWPQIMYSSTDHNCRVLLGSFGSHFGAIWSKFESIWRPNSKLLKTFWVWFWLFFWPKMASIPLNYVQLHWPKIDSSWGSLWGSFWDNLGHFGPIWRPNRQIFIILETISPLSCRPKRPNAHLGPSLLLYAYILSHRTLQNTQWGGKALYGCKKGWHWPHTSLNLTMGPPNRPQMGPK